MASQSAVVDHLSEAELFERWSDRWDHFLDDFSAASTSGTISERLRDKVKSGNAERAIAGGHERTFVRDVRESLPHELRFVLDRLFGEDRRPWREIILESESGRESDVIDWLAKNARALDATACFPQSVPSAYVRVLAVMNVWDRTETTELNDIDVWRSRLRALSTEANVQWVDRLPDRLQNEDADGELLFYYSPEDRFRSQVVTPLLEGLSGAIASETANLETMLRRYILEGELPEDEATVSAADHQDGALADLQSAAISGQQFSTESLLDAGFEVQSASTRTTGSGGGGGSTQYRGRGQQGEAATLVAHENSLVLDGVRALIGFLESVGHLVGEFAGFNV